MAELPFPLPSVGEVAALSLSSFAYSLPAHQLAAYHQHVCEILLACDGLNKPLLDFGDDAHEEGNIASQQQKTEASHSVMSVELDAISSSLQSGSSRRIQYTPLPSPCAENPLGAWTLVCRLSADADPLEPDAKPAPSHMIRKAVLHGKRVAVKDCIPVRGMPMCCGTSSSFTPLADSPLITRCLCAGAILVGKAQCEYMCFSTASHTSSAGAVHNAVAPEYHAGGSSSGSAVLVAAGEADLSIGCDQGGSIRIPAALNGVVGCKPTHGIVPYSLIDGMYGPVDHAGPITRTVEDNALMLGVLAGWDGADERASRAARSMEIVDYCEGLKGGVKGMKVGVLKEGFSIPFYMEEDVKKATEDAAESLREMGAKVEVVSAPSHLMATGIWVLSVPPRLVERLFHSKERDDLLGLDEQGKVYDRLTFMREHLLAHVASWSFQFRIIVLVGEWLRLHFPDAAKVANAYKRRLTESYASALSQADVLLMPTVPCKAKTLPTHDLTTAHDYEHASAKQLSERVDLGAGLTLNVCAFNITGHPALSVPIGGGIAQKGGHVNGSSDEVALPIGVMLVGGYFQEASLYRVAFALEQARPWRSFLYKGGHPIVS